MRKKKNNINNKKDNFIKNNINIINTAKFNNALDNEKINENIYITKENNSSESIEEETCIYENKELDCFNYQKYLKNIENLDLENRIKLYNNNNKKYNEIYAFLYSKKDSPNNLNWPIEIKKIKDKHKKKQKKTSFKRKCKISLLIIII